MQSWQEVVIMQNTLWNGTYQCFCKIPSCTHRNNQTKWMFIFFSSWLAAVVSLLYLLRLAQRREEKNCILSPWSDSNKHIPDWKYPTAKINNKEEPKVMNSVSVIAFSHSGSQGFEAYSNVHWAEDINTPWTGHLSSVMPNTKWTERGSHSIKLTGSSFPSSISTVFGVWQGSGSTLGIPCVHGGRV